MIRQLLPFCQDRAAYPPSNLEVFTFEDRGVRASVRKKSEII